MGEHMSLRSVAKPAAKEMDLMDMLDKATKLMDSPLGKMLMAKFQPAPGPETKTVYQEVPGETVKVGIEPRSPMHEKVFNLLNRMDEAQLEATFKQFAPEGVNMTELLG